MNDLPLLSIVTFVPLLGAVMLLFASEDDIGQRNMRLVALWTTSLNLVIALLIWFLFDHDSAAFQFIEDRRWFGLGVGYRMGVDGISILFIVLTAFLMPLCVLCGWDTVKHRLKEYLFSFLVLETTMIGLFATTDLVVFYLFFEAGLIPMFMIIGIWGGENRVYATFKFFLYTLLGSILMLIAIIAMYWQAGTTDIRLLLQHDFPLNMQWWLWIAFFAAFAVKLPMWPVHTWLPDAHVQAPTAGSVILAGVLLKMGGYGFLRFSLPMFPFASSELAPFVFTLSVIAIIYTSLVALAQTDMKKLIAYSSVAHMGFVTIGIFSANAQGIQGGIFQMLSHGLISSALFLCVGVIYDRTHTREIAAYGGLAERMPFYAFALMIFTMANIGLPGTSGFIGELLSVIGVFQVNTWVATLAAIGMILSACYGLWLYRRVVFGVLEKTELKAIMDVNRRELLLLAPLIILVLWFGFFPGSIFATTSAAVTSLITDYNQALAAIAESGKAIADITIVK